MREDVFSHVPLSATSIATISADGDEPVRYREGMENIARGRVSVAPPHHFLLRLLGAAYRALQSVLTCDEDDMRRVSGARLQAELLYCRAERDLYRR